VRDATIYKALPAFRAKGQKGITSEGMGMTRTGTNPHPKVWSAVNSLQELGYSFPTQVIRRKWSLRIEPEFMVLVRRHAGCLDIMRIDKSTGYCDYACRLPV
jgi:hypothetical protein